MKRVSLLICRVLTLALVGCGTARGTSQSILTADYSADIAAVLAEAGVNAPELQKVLAHYAAGDDLGMIGSRTRLPSS